MKVEGKMQSNKKPTVRLLVGKRNVQKVPWIDLDAAVCSLAGELPATSPD